MTLLFQFVDNGFQLKRIIEWFRNSYKLLLLYFLIIIAIENFLRSGILEKLSSLLQTCNGVNFCLDNLNAICKSIVDNVVNLFLYIFEFEFNIDIFKAICISIVDNVVSSFLYIFILYFGSHKIAEIKRKNAYNKVSKQNSNQKKETEKLFYGKCKLNGNPNVIDVLLEYHSENERSYLYLIFKGKGDDKKVDFLRDIKGLGVGYSYNIVQVFVSTIDYHVFIKTADQEKIHLVFCDSNNEVDKAMAFYEFMMIIKHLLKNEKLNVKIDFIDMREEVGPNVRIDPIYGIAEYLS